MVRKSFSFCVIMALLAAVVFYARFSMLMKSNEPCGLDGYYYALQAKSFVQTGQLENPDLATGFYFCGISSAICGDAILGCKVWSSIASCLFCFGCALLVYEVWGSLLAAVFVFLLTSVSPCSVSLGINYINNLTALAFFCFFASVMVDFAKKRIILSGKQKAFRILLALAFFVAASVTHLIAAVYCLAFLFVLSEISGVFGKLFEKFRSFGAKGRIFCFFGLVLLICGVSFVFVRELPRFSSVFSFGPFLPLFSSFMKQRLPFMTCLEMSFQFLLAWILTFVVCFSLGRKTKVKFLSLLVFPLVMFFPFWNLSILDMGYRVLLSGTAVSHAFIFCVLHFVIKTFDVNYFRKVKSAFIVIYCFCVAFLIFLLVFKTHCFYDPKKDPPYKYYRQVVKDIELSDDSLLIVHLGLNHVYTYYKNLRWALNYLPDFEVEKDNLWRLAYGADEDEIRCVLEENGAFSKQDIDDCVMTVDFNYILIREDLWQEYLSLEQEPIVECLKNWFNPSTFRPSFIRQ